MVKIFRLLTLALVMSAGGGALSAPVAEQSTKGTTSDLDPDALTPTTSGNLRGADGFGLLAHDGGEERSIKFQGASLDDVASGALSKVPTFKVTSAEADDMVKQAIKAKNWLDIFNYRVHKAGRLLNKGHTIPQLILDGVKGSHIQKFYLRKVSKNDRDGLLKTGVFKHKYDMEEKQTNGEFKKLVLGIDNHNKKFAPASRGVVMDRSVK